MSFSDNITSNDYAHLILDCALAGSEMSGGKTSI